ncbi:MAG: NUDIX domain-containing protein [Mesobacillus sp.]|uniref:NUDIX hydrolase n=1 Tax=Mesobacillus sp. TaxID=2675271 RepID=UPI003C487D6F
MRQENKMVVVVKGVILLEGRVLIVKRAADDEVGNNTWETVGGKMELGEDIEAALIREINEEIGITVTVDKILYATTFKTDPTRQIILLAYLCHSESHDIKLSAEHSDFKWATKEQLELLLPPEIMKDFEQNNVFSALGI